ncbi:hypothetical protein AVEN_68403-1 [Araneus ventricosus]|uniref:Uncharacterized protein n=1 Tax=Araneus ventricosus TaxID=182803 RepID=A0A4Y2H8X7_ARAVE|nr:hypothetical protein AVEN_68403-1 [Araneus ventricosus]
MLNLRQMKVKLLRGAHAWWGCGRRRKKDGNCQPAGYSPRSALSTIRTFLVFAFLQSRAASSSVGNSWITSFSAFMDSFGSVISSAASVVLSSVFS